MTVRRNIVSLGRAKMRLYCCASCGLSCKEVASHLLLDDDTVRHWYKLYEEDGVDGLAGFGHEGSSCRLDCLQQEKLKAWITKTLPRSSRERIGAWIEQEFSINYQGQLWA